MRAKIGRWLSRKYHATHPGLATVELSLAEPDQLLFVISRAFVVKVVQIVFVHAVVKVIISRESCVTLVQSLKVASTSWQLSL